MPREKAVPLVLVLVMVVAFAGFAIHDRKTTPPIGPGVAIEKEVPKEISYKLIWPVGATKPQSAESLSSADKDRITNMVTVSVQNQGPYELTLVEIKWDHIPERVIAIVKLKEE